MAHPAMVIFVCVAARSKPRPLKKKTPKIIRIIKEKNGRRREKKPFPIGCLTLFEHTSQLNNGRIPPSSIQPLYSSAPLYLSHRKCVAYSEGGPHRLSFSLFIVANTFSVSTSSLGWPSCVCVLGRHTPGPRPPSILPVRLQWKARGRTFYKSKHPLLLFFYLLRWPLLVFARSISWYMTMEQIHTLALPSTDFRQHVQSEE